MGMDIERSDLVAGYFEYFRSGFTESLMWAWETFHGGVPRTASDYFDLVLALLEGAPNEYCVELVGADALEHILWKSGDEVIEAVEAEATHNPRLRRALWIVGGLSDRPLLEARVRRILGDGPRPEAVERPADWAPLIGLRLQVDLLAEVIPDVHDESRDARPPRLRSIARRGHRL